MEELKRLWVEFSLTKFEVAIHNMLPWDVGGSRFLLWGSVAAFVIAALIVSQIFGWFFGWLVSRVLR
jgi:hypothetical protein